MILNKVDSSDPVATKEWQDYFESKQVSKPGDQLQRAVNSQK